MPRDYYEVLGVSKTATKNEIKSAYRKAALIYHPDRNKEPDAEAKFKELSEAYATLYDDEKRQRYDRFGHNAPQHEFVNSADIFGDLFGHDFFGQRRRGEDIKVPITISLEEVATGCQKEFTVSRQDACNKCSGNGGTGPICSYCNGYGRIERNVGFFSQVVGCNKCRGLGITITNKCDSCRGHGFTESRKTLSVKIPPGIRENDYLRVSGEGHLSSNDMPRGDVLCHIDVIKHPIFARQDSHLYVVQRVSFLSACQGAKINVPSISGDVLSVEIPPGTESGQIFRLKGRGLPVLKHQARGDQFVSIQIEVPKNITGKALKHLRDFDAAHRKAVDSSSEKP